MKRSGPQNPGQDDSMPWAAIAAAVIATMLWFALHEQISYVVMYVRLAESYLMVFDPEGKKMLAEWFATVHPRDAGIGQLLESGGVVGYTLRWFSLAIMVPLYAWLFLRALNRGGGMNKTYTMKSLAAQEANVYPTLKPVIGLDLENVPLDDRVNGMRMDARTYCRRNQLVLPGHTDRKLLPAAVEVLDDGRFFLLDKAEQVFSRQLGRRWEGVDRLRPFEKTLFAAFIAQLHFDEKCATTHRILNDVASVWSQALAKGDPSLLTTPDVEPVIAKYAESKKVVVLVRQHTHVRNVLRRLLEEARNSGKLPPGWMRWVKMIDRTTWYALDDLGLYVASVEAGGIHAHYMAEKMAGTAIATPMVKPAIAGAIEALNTYEDIDDEED